MRFTGASIFNTFILGSSETISKVMKAASDINHVGARYAWFAFTKVKLDPILLKYFSVNFYSAVGLTDHIAIRKGHETSLITLISKL